MPEQEFGSDGQSHPVDDPNAINRIRAFEDKHLGHAAIRINGQVEQGHGSHFKSLSPDHHRHYGALQNLAGAEAALSAATSAHAAAQAAYDEAKVQVDDSEIKEPEPAPEASSERSESEQGSA